MKAKKWNKALCIGLLSLFILSCALSASDNQQRIVYEGRITSVVDGDTIIVQFNTECLPQGFSRSERIRLIGVNTPELSTNPPDYYAEEARSYTNRFYQEKVFIVFDSVSALRDKYGRLLAYVYSDLANMSINKQLILGGYGYFYNNFSFDPYRMVEFRQAENYARNEKIGLWK